MTGEYQTPSYYVKVIIEQLLSPEDKAAYQAIVDEISSTEQDIAKQKALVDEAFEKLQGMKESVQELKLKAAAFREQKVEAEVSAPAL